MMDNNGQKPVSPSCGPECACNSPKGMSTRTKMICMGIIIIVAGVVLGNSLLRKSRSAITKPPVPGYSTAFSLKTSSSGAQQCPASETKPAMQNVSFTPLASLASLDTAARDMGGVFILLVNSDSEKTPTMLKEITAATNTITSHGTRTGVFQLAKTAPDYAMITSQMPAPGVLVAVKGRGMRGVQGSDIIETKLLQAWIAAMQPSGCCPAGGNRVCK